jgi:hypothetical protein
MRSINVSLDLAMQSSLCGKSNGTRNPLVVSGPPPKERTTFFSTVRRGLASNIRAHLEADRTFIIRRFQSQRRKDLSYSKRERERERERDFLNKLLTLSSFFRLARHFSWTPICLRSASSRLHPFHPSPPSPAVIVPNCCKSSTSPDSITNHTLKWVRMVHTCRHPSAHSRCSTLTALFGRNRITLLSSEPSSLTTNRSSTRHGLSRWHLFRSVHSPTDSDGLWCFGKLDRTSHLVREHNSPK